MKKIFILAIFVVISTTLSFAQVNDNTGPDADGKHSGTGTFGATILQPLTITTTQDGGAIGEFVKSSIEYTPFDENAFWENMNLIFSIEGESNQPFFYKIEQDELGTVEGIAQIELEWVAGTPEVSDLLEVGTIGEKEKFDTVFLSGTLDENGLFSIQASVMSIVAPTNSIGGEATFIQKVTVSYNNY